MEERRPMTREQIIIKEWARKTGAEPPPDVTLDANGLISGSCLKFGLGSPSDDDMAFVGRMQALGYEVRSSKDGMKWEYCISKQNADANLRKQHEKAIANVQPHKSLGDLPPGQEELPDTFESQPVSIDDVLKARPGDLGGYADALG